MFLGHYSKQTRISLFLKHFNYSEGPGVLDQRPGLIHDHIILDVHLDSQDGLERLRNHKIRIPNEKLGY